MPNPGKTFCPAQSINILPRTGKGVDLQYGISVKGDHIGSGWIGARVEACFKALVLNGLQHVADVCRVTRECQWRDRVSEFGRVGRQKIPLSDWDTVNSLAAFEDREIEGTA